MFVPVRRGVWVCGWRYVHCFDQARIHPTGTPQLPGIVVLVRVIEINKFSVIALNASAPLMSAARTRVEGGVRMQGAALCVALLLCVPQPCDARVVGVQQLGSQDMESVEEEVRATLELHSAMAPQA